MPPTPSCISGMGIHKTLQEEWLKNSTLDIEIDVSSSKPYDPEAPFRLVEYVKGERLRYWKSLAIRRDVWTGMVEICS